MSKRRVDKDRYPIILAHGIARFDELWRRLIPDWTGAEDSLHYFRKIRTVLRQEGFAAFHSTVPWAESLAARAASLRRQVLEIAETHGKVHIIAHSMGGLDARQMIFNEGKADPDRMVDKVASLSTISTPHRGSSMADEGIERLGGLIERFGALHRALAGFFDLTREKCEAFNARAEAFERDNGVIYQTFAGVQENPDRIFPLLRGSHALIRQREGPNDGLVSLSSAKWREAMFVGPPLEADHFNELGWWDISEIGHTWPHELEGCVQRFYVNIAESLCVESLKRW